jgi:flagellar basal-body rod modification protein FlgD
METVKGSNPLEGIRWQKEEYKVAEQDKGMLTQADFFCTIN